MPQYTQHFLDWFFARVAIQPNGCWYWTAKLDRDGYGVARYRQQYLAAHRLSWEMHNSRATPDGLEIMHSCDVRRCVNPEHLSPGTHQQNMEDAARKGRMS